MLTIEAPFDELTRQVLRMQARSQAARPQLAERLGDRLKALAVESFEKRSQGQPDAGITWEPLSDAYLQQKREAGYGRRIGIGDGTLLDSAEVLLRPQEITLEFTAPFAPLFDSRRPLLPDELPTEWRDELEDIASDHQRQIFEEEYDA